MAPSNQSLTAEYRASDAATRSFTQALPGCSRTPATEERTAYLSALHTSVGKMQDVVNAFLTQKMEEDKNAAGSTADAATDAKEEENYGEEVVEDEG